jgi:hypothetical protein
MHTTCWLAELNVRTLNHSVIFMKEKDVLYIICFIYLLFCLRLIQKRIYVDFEIKQSELLVKFFWKINCAAFIGYYFDLILDEVNLKFGSSTLQINFGTVLVLDVNKLLID